MHEHALVYASVRELQTEEIWKAFMSMEPKILFCFS